MATIVARKKSYDWGTYALDHMLAVSERGISEPLFFKAGLAVNKEMYISKCPQTGFKFFFK
jgi:hypothetical protein